MAHNNLSQENLSLKEKLLLPIPLFTLLVMPSYLLEHWKNHDLSLLNKVTQNYRTLNQNSWKGGRELKEKIILDGNQYQIKIPPTPNLWALEYKTGETSVKINYHQFFPDFINVYYGNAKINSPEIKERARKIGEKLLQQILALQEQKMEEYTKEAKKDLQ